MPERTKIATCCYCGSRTMLTLAGRVQHHLACSACGAPLSQMKALKAEAPEQRPKPARRAQMPPHRPATGYPPEGQRKQRRRKPFAARLFDRIEDAVEEIVDLFD